MVAGDGYVSRTVLDELAAVAAAMFEVPVATVSLLEAPPEAGRGRDVPRLASTSFAAVVATGRTVVVPELPATGGVRFFAGAPVLHPDGRVLGAFCLADSRPRNFGERQRMVLAGLARQAAQHVLAQAQSQELARARAREEDFIATVSHELRTPVAVMRGYLEALAEQDELAPYRGMIDPIRRSGDRLVRMVDHLLAGTHPETLVTVRPGHVDLSCVARAAVACVLTEARRMNVRIRLETAADPAPVSGDFGRLCQVVEHLVRNAVLFSGPGGEVVVRATADENGPGLEVADHGVGVPADELPYLTERFYRGRHARAHAVPGVGLGLSIAESIVAAHGGTLTLTSAGPGQGVTAGIRMPALHQPAEHCTTVRRARRVRAAHRTRP